MIEALLLALSLQAAPAAKAAAKPSPPSAAATAPTPADATPRVRGYGDLVLSPDGSRVADVESIGAKPGIALRPAVGGALVPAGLVEAFCAACRLGDLAWSPDGRWLAYVARDGKAGAATLVVEGVAPTVAPRAVARLKGLISTPRWSADGKTLAVLATANPRKQTGATQAGAAVLGEVGSAFDSQRIAVVAASGGELRFVSPDGTFVYEYDWTPDGRGFVGTAAKGDGDNNWWVAKLEAFGIDGSERVIAAPAMQMNYPRVSPDGRSVAFIGGLMSDFGSVGGDVFIAPVSGGEPKNLTPGYKGTFTSLDWAGDTIHASALVGADAAVAVIRPEGGVTLGWRGPWGLGAGDGRVSFSADGRSFATVRQSFEQAPAVVVGATAGGEPRQLTHDNDNLPANVRAQNVTWTRAGSTVQGWLLAPRSPPSGKAPLLVKVHGGPAAASTPTYLSGGTDKRLLDKGYWIFLPNPRGSYGQGEAFVQANKRDFGGADLADILAGVDAAAKVAPIDLDRLGVYGGSYGGFMTMWAVTHTDRFKAGVAAAGLSNWSSYYGTNGIDQWMIPYFGKSFYEDPAIYDKLSAVRYIKDAKTPTLIYVGERDIECPPGQSIEFWHGLKQYNVPTSLVIYEGEGHGIRDPKNSKDAADRTIAWFDRYLAAK